MEQYLTGIVERYRDLAPEQQQMVQNFVGTEEGQIVALLLGPEVAGLMTELQNRTAPPEPDFLQG